MAKMLTRRSMAVLGRWMALVLPAVIIASPDARATTVLPGSEEETAVVREIGGALYFSERGTLIPVPDGPATAALRDLVRAAEKSGSLALDVGRTIVADGASGWHGTDKKP